MLAALPLIAALLAPAEDFKNGDFDAAQRGYLAEWQADPSSSEAVFGLAALAIYDNRLTDAKMWLDRAQRLAPSDPRIVRYRTTIALRSDPSIDRVIAGGESSTVPFVTTDPLPTIRVSVNGHPATFVIDTGAPNIALDPAFAQSLGLTSAGSHEGTFAGGLHASVGQTTVERLDLGAWSLGNVPAAVLPVGNILGAEHPVQGVIGTALFAHFLTTLDYVHGSLILRNAGQSPSFEAAERARDATIVPLWLVGDHFLFVRAHAGDGPEGLFNVDTGGTFGIQLTKDALDAAHVSLDTGKTSTGMGGGGATAFVPFTTSATIGGFTEDRVDGIYTPQGDQFGIFPFTVTGTLSHEFFRHCALTFDFSAMRMIVDRG